MTMEVEPDIRPEILVSAKYYQCYPTCIKHTSTKFYSNTFIRLAVIAIRLMFSIVLDFGRFRPISEYCYLHNSHMTWIWTAYERSGLELTLKIHSGLNEPPYETPKLKMLKISVRIRRNFPGFQSVMAFNGNSSSVSWLELLIGQQTFILWRRMLYVVHDLVTGMVKSG